MEYLDLNGVKNEDINEIIKNKLHEISEKNTGLTIKNVKSMNNICAGLSDGTNIIIDDSTGLYTGSYMNGLKLTVKGNVGWYAGDDMMSGQIIIEKNTGCNLGAYIFGGDIVVRGNTGSRAGYGMKGGNIIICGNAGRWSGQMAMGGNLVILGNVGFEIGASMYRGRIFANNHDGNLSEKLGANVYIDEITDEEVLEINILFAKYNIDFPAEKLSVIRPKTSHSDRDEYKIFKPALDINVKKYNIYKSAENSESGVM
jgi:glutamate synthase domain-containing protein 3